MNDARTPTEAPLSDPSPTLMEEIKAVTASMGIYFNRPALVKTIDEIKRAYPDLPILVGGQAFRFEAKDTVPDRPGVFYIASLDEFEQQLAAHE